MTIKAAKDNPLLAGELRPVRLAFLVQRVAPVVLVLFVVWIAALIGREFVQPPGISTLHVVVGGVTLLFVAALTAGFWAATVYAKERYEFFDHRIVVHRGTLVSDETSELMIRNITHVKRRLPWPRFPLFGVGDVMIESAGSEASEIRLRTIRRPDHVYEGVMALMRANGFNISRDELLHEERPNKIAVAIECAGMTLAAIAATIAALAELYFEDEGSNKIGLYLSLLPLLGIVAIVFHYLDMCRRTYRVYADTVMYEEGFLTRDDAFIPGENIADSSTRRGLIDQLLGLYDVQISCQGSNGEIQFRRLRNGPALSNAVERAVAHTAELATDPARDFPETHATGDRAGAQQAIPAIPSTGTGGTADLASATVTEDCWTAELRQSPWRAVAPFVVLCIVLPPLTPIWVLAIVRGMINALCTHYAVRPSSIRERFQFLHSTEREFSYDKVTGAVVRENPFDRLLGTVTVSIWSIGSAQPLELAHVQRNRLELTALLQQLGIPEPDPVEQIRSCFSLPRMFLATLPLQLVLTLVVAAIPVLAFVWSGWSLLALVPLAAACGALLGHRLIYYPRCCVTVHRTYLECREGWLWRQHFYARHDNIKRVELTRYPKVDVGTVRFVVAGEHRPRSSPYAMRKKSKKPFESFGTSSYGFQVRYAEQIGRHAWALDERLRGADPSSHQVESPERESGPALANSLVGLIFVSIAVAPLVVLLPLTVPWMVLVVRRRRYFVERHRVLVRRGILYRSQASILHDRIDSLRRNQRLLGKCFGNGTVTILTAGSSQPDLELTNAPDYLQLYELLQQHYKE